MTNEVQDEQFEQPPVRAADMPVGARFKIQYPGSMGNTWLTMLKGGRVQIGEGGGRLRQTATIDSNAVVTEAMLPTQDEAEERLKRERESNRERDVWVRAPEWALRLEQGKVRHKTEQALNGLPVYGPDKNPLDRERRKTAWQNIPMNSFFVIFDQNPKASVYAKVSNGLCQKVCSLEEWTSGNVPFTWRDTGENDRRIEDLKIEEDSIVTVLNAPTASETREWLDAAKARREEEKRPADAEQLRHWEYIQSLSDNFSLAD